MKPPEPPSKFTGADRYWRAAESWYNVTLTPEQREIAEAVAENQYVLLQGANGFGKSFGVAALSLAFFRRHYPSSVVVTSGTFGKLKRTFCAEVEHMHENSVFAEYDEDFNGRWKWSPNPNIDVPGEPQWQFEVASPSDAGELEGIHNDHMLVIIDEADKDAVDEYVIDSMDSLLSDENCKMIVVCNPPSDESNVVFDLQQDPKFKTIRYSTFDSHNVQVEIGNREGPPVPGLTGLSKLKKNWVSYNGEGWPGVEEASKAHLKRNDLDTRWYRRHAGVMPPESADVYRPYTRGHINWVDSYDYGNTPLSVGIDVARMGGDHNVMIGKYPDGYQIIDRWQGVDHNVNYQLITNYLEEGVPYAIDAQGEGSGLADRLGGYRFKSGSLPANQHKFFDKWAEGLYHLGLNLQDGALISDHRLREELAVSSRIIQFDEKYYKSRKEKVLKATPKRKVEKELKRSPDCLDAAVIAEWIYSAGGNDRLIW